MTLVKSELEFAPREESVASRRQRRIESFHPSYRRFVGDLTRCSVALEDLADSFPALLFALATGYATPAARERAFELASAGAPLREAAEALGLPWWLRRLPPEAFTAPLQALPADPEFTLRIAGVIPREPRLTPSWLTHVGHACEACGKDYALWIARQPDVNTPPDDLFMFLAAWAWFSGRPGLLGHRLLRRPWHADMSFKRAREEMAAWRQRLRLIECLGPGIETPWLADGAAAGYSFVALRTVDDFIAESEALENCLDQYADQLRNGLTAIFSIRKGARSVACVEIGLHEAEVTMPTIVQLRAARNRRAPPEVWQATFGWLGSQRLEPLSPERHVPKPMKRIEARRQMWGPYLDFLSGARCERAFGRMVLERKVVRPRQRGERGPSPQRAATEVEVRLRTLGDRARPVAQVTAAARGRS